MLPFRRATRMAQVTTWLCLIGGPANPARMNAARSVLGTSFTTALLTGGTCGANNSSEDQYGSHKTDVTQSQFHIKLSHGLGLGACRPLIEVYREVCSCPAQICSLLRAAWGSVKTLHRVWKSLACLGRTGSLNPRHASMFAFGHMIHDVRWLDGGIGGKDFPFSVRTVATFT
ncbi:hypothetical protein L207DRAFT_103623 [Hyaloscypha variabilis F]|uniref:Uncharacterized protein n=1 Tax=Hyaloscypha variabilis (strain UAMH 11265 / GT02V1 / F) TaxID=1149755 RepID=A0A2J6RCE6_HYAVF|nr:hypothetical protein L207DRAFT_103623 [Hyaloscypha variabilis F]